ncbi:DUF4167 domain-containing protein [Pararhizobium sp. LjRoot255]|uniref:DUF4167 domain-containing protein n=1 Tax=Pararhizobium sp. LjRoot255 TaxID=3342298 RepID=UPI003ECD8227
MRPGQQNKRGRGRNNNNNSSSSNSGGGGNHNRKGSNPLTRTYDSSGPDVKIRGTAQHIAEKYATLARDAQSSGDRVVAENYLQHAEHYNRIIAAAQAQMQERFQRDDRSDYSDRNEYQDRDGNERDDDLEQNDIDESFAIQDQQPDLGRPQQADRQPRQHDGERRDRQRHDRQRQPRPEQGQPQARPDVQPQPIIDGSGPQPVIEGTPVEVSLEEEAPTGRAASRRRAAPRPRRQPRREAGGDEAAAETGGEQPAEGSALAEAAGE